MPAPVAYRSVGALAVAEEARFVLVDVTVARARGWEFAHGCDGNRAESVTSAMRIAHNATATRSGVIAAATACNIAQEGIIVAVGRWAVVIPLTCTYVHYFVIARCVYHLSLVFTGAPTHALAAQIVRRY